MKIALTGPSGSGKTTMANMIINYTHYRFISMSAGDILTPEDKRHLHSMFGYMGTGHANVIRLSNTNPEFSRVFQLNVAVRRGQVIKGNDNFVIDRSPVDNLAYYLLQTAPFVQDCEVEDFIHLCKELVNNLDIIIFCPSLAPQIEDNDSRIANLYYQRAVTRVFHYAIELLQIPENKIFISDTWGYEEKESCIRKILLSKGFTI